MIFGVDVCCEFLKEHRVHHCCKFSGVFLSCQLISNDLVIDVLPFARRFVAERQLHCWNAVRIKMVARWCQLLLHEIYWPFFVSNTCINLLTKFLVVLIRPFLARIPCSPCIYFVEFSLFSWVFGNATPQTFVDPVMVDADAMDGGAPMLPDGEPPPLSSPAEPQVSHRLSHVSRLSSDGCSSAPGSFVEILKQIQARCTWFVTWWHDAHSNEHNEPEIGYDSNPRRFTHLGGSLG